MKVLVIPGSLREKSFNKSIANYIKNNFSGEIEFEVFTLNNIPMFNEDLESHLPDEVSAVIELIKESEGVIFVTPEYNNSLPAPTRNLLHWLSRSYSNKYVIGKPLGIVGVSDGGFGTVRAQHELLLIATVIGLKVDPKMRLPISYALEIFDDEINLVDEKVKLKIEKFINDYQSWIKS